MKAYLFFAVAMMTCNISMSHASVIHGVKSVYSQVEVKNAFRTVSTLRNQEYKLKWIDIKNSKKIALKQKPTWHSLSSINFNEIRMLSPN